MEGEIPTPPTDPGSQLDMEIAPRNPVDSETRPGVADRLAQVRENPSLLDASPGPQQPESPRSNFHELQGKIATPGSEYTEEEAFYLEHGWKAYAKEYGNRGYALEDIARSEHLQAQDIRGGIEDGTIEDPDALHLYGQMKLDQTKLFWTQWEVANTLERDDARILAASQIATTEAECLPLVHGNAADLAQYSTQQAELALLTAESAEDNEKSANRYDAAASWYKMSARLAKLRSQEKGNQKQPARAVTPPEE
jgi:hypothetical protein